MLAEQGDAPRWSGDAPLAQVIGLAARGVAGVAGLSGAPDGSAPPSDREGELVAGVQYTRTAAGLLVVLHLVALPVPLLPLAAAVRTAVAAAVAQVGSPAAAVDVWVDALAPATPGAEAP